MKDIYDLLHEKISDTAEVSMSLFEHCDMNCAFCAQDHDSLAGATEEEILSKIDIIGDWAQNNRRPTERYTINVIGGELFSDYMVDRGMLDIYQRLIDKMVNRLPDEDLTFNFNTNLVHTNTEPVLDFIVKNKLKLSVSYDPTGRFTPRQLAIFKDNVEIYKEHIARINTLITKGNIKNVVAGNDYYDYLYSQFETHWEEFIPFVDDVARNVKMMPSESELFTLYKLIVDKYPNSNSADPFLRGNSNQKMSCTRGNNLSLNYDNTTCNCYGGHMMENGGEATGTGIAVQSSDVVVDFLNKYNCFSCQYFSNCPFTCFASNMYSKTERDLGMCVFKATFDYVENKFHKSSSR